MRETGRERERGARVREQTNQYKSISLNAVPGHGGSGKQRGHVTQLAFHEIIRQRRRGININSHDNDGVRWRFDCGTIGKLRLQGSISVLFHNSASQRLQLWALTIQMASCSYRLANG